MPADHPSTNGPSPAPKVPGLLLNKTQLARALGKDRKFVTAMCRWGETPFQLALGGCTTLDDALTWLRATPKFPGIRRPPTPFNHRKTRPRVKQAASL
jgi:hypothetical protein